MLAFMSASVGVTLVSDCIKLRIVVDKMAIEASDTSRTNTFKLYDLR